MNLKAHKRIKELKQRVDSYSMEVTNGFISYAYEDRPTMRKFYEDDTGSRWCCLCHSYCGLPRHIDRAGTRAGQLVRINRHTDVPL